MRMQPESPTREFGFLFSFCENRNRIKLHFKKGTTHVTDSEAEPILTFKVAPYAC